jgi:putative acyl-CoA dehydrogenase
VHTFIQDKPQLSNQFISDILLVSYLQGILPSDVYDAVKEDFTTFGQRVVLDLLDMGNDVMMNEPELINYDAWGNRIDKVQVSSGWVQLKDVSAIEGLVGLGYHRSHNEFSRIIQFTKLYLFTPSSAIYTCPLAMTDGAARLIEIYGDEYLKTNVLPHYISRNPQDFWVSGQWMTEKTGGSDLARTETIARKENDEWKLYGPKWFTSAITAQTSMTLARIEEDGEEIRGSRGLSLFYLKIRDENGKLNNIQINRLKDKLGTRGLPTAELDLIGTPAILVGEVGRGIKQIATMLNITRIYNAISAVSLMRRALAIAKDYAYKREAFERFLIDLPLHAETLAISEIEFTGSFLLTFYVVELLGKSECQAATEEENKLLRLLTPVAKLYTGKISISVISELLECMGGAGYLEDTGIPSLLRDAQVLSIWEGTTNVLSLDVLRSINKEDTFTALISILKAKMERFPPGLLVEKSLVELELNKLVEFAKNINKQDSTLVESQARNFSIGIAKVTISVLLVELISKVKDEKEKARIALIAERWLENNKIELKQIDSDHILKTKSILGHN